MAIPILSGLVRSVWTTTEQKLLMRCANLLNSHGDKMLLRCGNRTCPDPVIAVQGDEQAPGGRVLQCGCTKRVFTTAH